MSSAQLHVVSVGAILVIGLAVLARALRAEGRTPAVLIFGILMLGFAAVPRNLFSDTIAVAVGLGGATLVALILAGIIDALAAVAIVVMAMSVLYLAWWLYALVLVFAVLVALVGLGMAVTRLLRARLGAAAGPDSTTREVLMGGNVRGPAVQSPPGLTDHDDLAWWAAVVHDATETFVSGDLVLEGERTPIIVRGTELTFDFRLTNTYFPSYTDPVALLVALGCSEQDARQRIDTLHEGMTASERAQKRSYRVYGLPAGAAVSVVGIPDWDRAPDSGVYRDAPVVPVFADKHLGPPHLLDRSLSQARREAWYDAIAWTTTGTACAAALAYLSHAGVL